MLACGILFVLTLRKRCVEVAWNLLMASSDHWFHLGFLTHHLMCVNFRSTAKEAIMQVINEKRSNSYWEV